MTGLIEALDPELAREYRRGYRHGAKAMLGALAQQIPREQAQELLKLLEAEFLDWVDGGGAECGDAPVIPCWSPTADPIS